MNTRYAVWSDKGHYRSINEDNFYMNGAAQPETGLTQTTEGAARCSERIQMFAVCDGMGGEASGELASAAVAKGLSSLKRAVETSGDMAAFNECVAQINRDVIAATEGKGGATVTGVIIRDDEFVTINAGDSRTYLIRDGKVRQLTKDHSQLQQLLDSGALKPEDAASYAHKNVITRHFGMSEEYGAMELTLTAAEKVLPGDRFLICSDGVHGDINDMEIAELAGTGRVQEAAERIAARALDNGTRDNLTAMVIEVCKEKPASNSKKKAGKQKNSKALIAALLAIIVLLAGALIFVIVNSGKKPADEEIIPEITETVTDEAEENEAENSEEAGQPEAEPTETADEAETENVTADEAEPEAQTVSEDAETQGEENTAAEETQETESEPAEEAVSLPPVQNSGV